MLLPCPHFSISIVQRSKGQSVVSAAAYQSGERLFCEYDHKTKHYSNKREVVYSNILAPIYSPTFLENRNTLWNSVEQVETRYDSQLARRIVMALPKEIPRGRQIELIEEYCFNQFILKGMFADIAIHDKGDGNPHAHVLLTLRPVDENGRWLPKCRMVYDLDEHGQKQKTTKGNWKCHKEPTVDWNDRKYAEVWRKAWENTVNRYYELEGLTERIDLRSYARQKTDRLPTVHMGPSVTQMEKRSIRTDVGNLNRDIRAHNSGRRWLNRNIRMISERLEELTRLREDAAVKAFPYDKEHRLIDLLWAYYDIRADERKSWSRYAQRKASVNDLQAMVNSFEWLKQNGLLEIEDFNARFDSLQQEIHSVTSSIDTMENERRHKETLYKHLINRKEYRPVYEQYIGKVFKSSKQRFGEEHREELDQYRTAVRYFKAHPDESDMDLKALVAEHKKLKAAITAEQEKLTGLKTRLEPFGKISYYLSQVFRPVPIIEETDGRESQTFSDKSDAESRNDRDPKTDDRQSIASKPKKHKSEPSL